MNSFRVYKTQLVLILLLPFLLKEANSSQLSNNLYDLVKIADKKIVDLTAPSDLFGIKEFLIISKSPKEYLPIAKKLISDETLTEQQKLIIVYGMQELLWQDYLEFLSSATVDFNNKEVEESVIELIISPTHDWSTRIAAKYNDPTLKSLLESIKTLKDSKLNNEINRILSGQARESAINSPFYNCMTQEQLNHYSGEESHKDILTQFPWNSFNKQ